MASTLQISLRGTRYSERYGRGREIKGDGEATNDFTSKERACSPEFRSTTHHVEIDSFRRSGKVCRWASSLRSLKAEARSGMY